MARSARNHKITLISDVGKQKEANHSSQGQQSKAASRRTHSIIRESVTSIEHAMDIAIGAEGESWDEEKEAA